MPGTVEGQFCTFEGTPLAGFVDLVPRTRFATVPGRATMFLPDPVRLELDATGWGRVEGLVCPVPGSQPTGWVWEARPHLTTIEGRGVPFAPFLFEVVDGAVTDLTEHAPVVEDAGVWVTRGKPGPQGRQGEKGDPGRDGVSGAGGLTMLDGMSPAVPKTVMSGGEYSVSTAAAGQMGRTSRQWFVPVEPVVFARFLFQNLKTVHANVNNPIEITASVERVTSPTTVEPVRVTFGGAQKVTLAPGQWVLSDPVMVGDDTASGFFVRTFTGVSEVGMKWPSTGHTRGALYPGELAWWGDKTGTADTAGGFAGTTLAHGPAAILTAATMKPVVSVVGDSITQGVNDGGSGEGYWTRYGNSAKVRVNKAAANGELGRYVLDPANGRDAIWVQVAGSEHLVCALGTNDTAQWQSVAGIKEQFPKIWDRMRALARKGVWQVTLPPNTTSTDKWATLGNQTYKAFEQVRQDINAWFRAGAPIEGRGKAGDPGHPLSGVLDVGAAVEDQDTGKWLPGMSSDGTHPSAQGHEAMAAKLAEVAPTW